MNQTANLAFKADPRKTTTNKKNKDNFPSQYKLFLADFNFDVLTPCPSMSHDSENHLRVG